MPEERMEMNEQQESSEKGFKLNVKNMIRIIALISMIFCFIPTFLVSCSGQTVKLSVLDCLVGLESQGEKITDAHPICILYLLIPIVVFIIWILKKHINEKQMVMSTAICSVIDLVMWFILNSQIKATAEENYCSARPTIAYWINIILWMINLILSVAMMLGYLSPEGETEDIKKSAEKIAGAATKKAQEASEKIQENVKQQIENHTVQKEHICPKCGSKIPEGNLFCVNCGTKIENTLENESTHMDENAPDIGKENEK